MARLSPPNFSFGILTNSSVRVKHKKITHEVDLDPTSTGLMFKIQLYSLTEVPPERQSVSYKGFGRVTDETDMSAIGVTPGMVFYLLGSPLREDGDDGLGRPTKEIKFQENMTEAELAKIGGALPAGLKNYPAWNTCYLNSALQTFRFMPELQEALANYTSDEAVDLTAALGRLYKAMGKSLETYDPTVFITILRAAFPQFAEKSKSGPGYAQQDANEAWSQILSQLRGKLKTTDSVSVVDKFIAGRFETTLECKDPEAKARGEVLTRSEEVFLQLSCPITTDTRDILHSIRATLEEEIDKHSSSLDREAKYTKKTLIARLPKYFTVHLLRFDWLNEKQVKAKKMRRVTFPSEFDAIEFCTNELKGKIAPIRDKIGEVRNAEVTFMKARKTSKLQHEKEEDRKIELEKSRELIDRNKTKEKGKDTEIPEVGIKTDAERDAEEAAIVLKAKKELVSLIHKNLKELVKDDGLNKSGLYDLRAVVTHAGRFADSGHYTAFVKKEGVVDGVTGKRGEVDGNWWWFDDAKVTEVGPEMIKTLAGGGKFQYLIVEFALTLSIGESHSAFILLYRAIDLPTAEELGMEIAEDLKEEVIDKSAEKAKDSVVEDAMDEAPDKVDGKPGKEAAGEAMEE